MTSPVRDEGHPYYTPGLFECVKRIRESGALPLGQRVGEILAGDYLVEFRPVDRSRLGEYLGQACRYYGHERFEAIVMFWPDRDGAPRRHTGNQNQAGL